MSEQVPLEGIEQRVIEAYKTKGLKASPHILTGESCCAIGALCSGDAVFYSNGIEKFAQEVLRWDTNALWNFIAGFDDYFSTPILDRRKSVYINDPYFIAGVKTAKAVIEARLYR